MYDKRFICHIFLPMVLSFARFARESSATKPVFKALNSIVALFSSGSVIKWEFLGASNLSSKTLKCHISLIIYC